MLEDFINVRLSKNAKGRLDQRLAGDALGAFERFASNADRVVEDSGDLVLELAKLKHSEDLTKMVSMWEGTASIGYAHFALARTSATASAATGGYKLSEIEPRAIVDMPPQTDDIEIAQAVESTFRKMATLKGQVEAGLEEMRSADDLLPFLEAWDVARERAADMLAMEAQFAKYASEMVRRITEGTIKQIQLPWTDDSGLFQEGTEGGVLIHNPFGSISFDTVDEASGVQYGEYTGTYPSRVDDKMRSKHVMAIRQVAAKLGARLPKGAKAAKIAYNQSTTRLALRVSKSGSMTPAEIDATPGSGDAAVIHLIADNEGKFQWGLVEPGKRGAMRGRSRIGGAIQKITKPIQDALAKLSESEAEPVFTQPSLNEAKKVHAANAKYLAKVKPLTKDRILKLVAKHYGITTREAEAELTDPDAEDVYEYLAFDNRFAMQVYRDFKRMKEDLDGDLEERAGQAPEDRWIEKLKRARSKKGTMRLLALAVIVMEIMGEIADDEAFKGVKSKIDPALRKAMQFSMGSKTEDLDAAFEAVIESPDEETMAANVGASIPMPFAVSVSRSGVQRGFDGRPKRNGKKPEDDEDEEEVDEERSPEDRAVKAMSPKFRAYMRELTGKPSPSYTDIVKALVGQGLERKVAKQYALFATEKFESMDEDEEEPVEEGKLPSKLAKHKFTKDDPDNPNPKGNDRDGDGKTGEAKPFTDEDEDDA